MHVDDSHRSVSLTAFLKLLAVPRIALVSLQKGPYSDEPQTSGVDVMISDLGAGLGNFAKTASIVEQLDLVITFDTSVVNLASVMGKPVWTLLVYREEWCWIVGRDGSPWYPGPACFGRRAPATVPVSCNGLSRP